MKLPASLFAALFVLSPCVSADIYKCKDAKGNDKYQNFPCPIDSIGSKATAAPPKDDGGKASPQAAAKQPAPEQKQLTPGMKMIEVRNGWGTPKTTKVSKGIESWYYEGQAGASYAVRFDRTGTLLSIDEVPTPPDDDE